MPEPELLELTMEEEYEPFGQCFTCPNPVRWDEDVCNECREDSR